MKKALAFILASFVFASVFFKSISAKASDFAIPESGWLPVIYDIFYSLVNGNEIDVFQLAGELSGINAVIEKYNEFRNTHFETGIEGGLSLLNTSLFTYASSMYEGDLYDLAAKYSIYLKDGTYPILGRYTKDRITRWNQYNTQFNDKYLDSFAVGSYEPQVFPDPNYLDSLARINGDNGSGYDFFWSDASISYGDMVSNNRMSDNLPTYSYVVPYSLANNSESNIVPSIDISSQLLVSDIITININNINDSYTISLSGYNVTDKNTSPNNLYLYTYHADTNTLSTSSATMISLTTYNNSYSWSNNLTINGFPYLSDAINFIKKNFRNVNIFVNGTPWALVGDFSFEDIITGPDVIRNDNGLIDSQDVFVPDQELAFDLIGLINLLEDKLNGIDTTIDFDDLITDGIIVNPDGTALDDARSHILNMTIQRVIADEQERDDPEPVATTTPPPYPTFPEVDWRKNPIPEPLPTSFDTSNGNPTDAFSGASTLAQIVDATNRGLPSELVYTFWGIVFGMIVLGVIKVLHK